MEAQLVARKNTRRELVRIDDTGCRRKNKVEAFAGGKRLLIMHYGQIADNPSEKENVTDELFRFRPATLKCTLDNHA